METTEKSNQFESLQRALSNSPEFDPERLSNEFRYRVDMLDKFIIHMESLAEFEDKVRYFMYISKAMKNGHVQGFNTGPITAKIKYLDLDDLENEELESTELKYMSLVTRRGSEEAEITNQIYFFEYFLTDCICNTANVRGKGLDAHKKHYYNTIKTHANPSVFLQSEYEHICETIEGIQQKFNSRIEQMDNRDKEAHLLSSKAAMLIERTVNKVKGAIKWRDFYRLDQLIPFAQLWELVEYKVFLNNILLNSTELIAGNSQVLIPLGINYTSNKLSKPPVLPQYSSFEELFQNPSDIDAYIKILRGVEVDHPLFDECRNWTGQKGSKAYLVAWIDRLLLLGEIQNLPRKKDIVPLLNNFFPGLNMGVGGSSLSERKGKYDEARDFFITNIPKKIAK